MRHSTACPIASRTRRARTCSSTPTTRSTGTRGAPRRSSGPGAEDKPIFLSIGYSACHWCHVMEREIFENAEIAALMNERLRLDQGRPRGAARPRRHLHDRRPGDDRLGRLADERLPDARAEARSSAAPTSRPRTGTGCPAFPQVLDGGRRRVRDATRAEVEQQAGALAGHLSRAAGGAGRARATPERRQLDAAVARLARDVRRGARRLRRRAEVPARR